MIENGRSDEVASPSKDLYFVTRRVCFYWGGGAVLRFATGNEVAGSTDFQGVGRQTASVRGTSKRAAERGQLATSLSGLVVLLSETDKTVQAPPAFSAFETCLYSGDSKARVTKGGLYFVTFTAKVPLCC